MSANEPTTESIPGEPTTESKPAESTAVVVAAHAPHDPVDPALDAIKDSNVARDAFARQDAEASKAEHQKRTVKEEPHMSEASGFVKSFVFGGLDGITTAFAVVTAAAGGGQNWRTVLVFGIANVIADGFAMGIGEYVSGTAEMDLAQNERDREKWEVENNIEGERAEMRELYESRGFSAQDAKEIVDIISQDTEKFVDVMMVHELGLLVDLDDPWEPLKQAIVMFCAFLFFGLFPLYSYMGGVGSGTDYIFGISCAVTGVGLLVLGFLKGKLSGANPFITALKMLIQGVVSGGVSYAVGVLIEYIVKHQ
jgi:VIT1/CCC1 family predicted Fe2+/Mn2+ transporter